jgi:hypothetical protein
MLSTGVHIQYHQYQLPMHPQRCFLYFFDLIDRYRDAVAVEKGVCRIVKYCAMHQIPFLCKLHPRETEEMQTLICGDLQNSLGH